MPKYKIRANKEDKQEELEMWLERSGDSIALMARRGEGSGYFLLTFSRDGKVFSHPRIPMEFGLDTAGSYLQIEPYR